jgi:hypothetical protein
MTLPSPTVYRRIRQLFALMGSPNANEAANARASLTKLLTKHGLSWNDLSIILTADGNNPGNPPHSRTAARPEGPNSGPEVNVLDLVLRLLELHVAVTAEERMAIALWTLHTHVFDKFSVTPRLALLSPVRGCGKTTLLMLLELLVVEPYRTDNVSAATIYHLLDRRSHTLLIDEGDNLGLLNNGVLRTVFNSGHRRGGGVSRFVGGWARKFPTFAPLAVAAIGLLPLPLLHRSVVINMQRASGDIERLDENNLSFPASREQIRKWAATCTLAQDPEMPSSLRNRAADNWRPLLAIAEALGHGENARAAAIALCSNHPDEDPGVVLLADIRAVFQALNTDRIPSAALVEALLALDDGFWNDWRGPKDDRPPRKLSQSELALLLRPFRIQPKTIWPLHRQPGSRSYRGYMRSWFEAAWAAYCPPADTPTHVNKIIHLPRS